MRCRSDSMNWGRRFISDRPVMLTYLSEFLAPHWGPARLLTSYTVLATVGALFSAILSLLVLPRVWHVLTTDKGRAHAVNAEDSIGKPVGVGLFIVLITVSVLVICLPYDPQLYFCLGALLIASCVGYLDDRKPGGLSELTLGLTDLAISLFVCVVLMNGSDAEVWLPFTSAHVTLPWWGGVLLYTPIVWLCINAVNCNDGVDGVSGTLSAVTICVLGFLLYSVVGDITNARYLLIPYNPDAVSWALAAAVFCGAILGYLWHNAPPSAALMGDAGSRPIGLFVGMCVVATGNPATVFFVGALLLFNGATGLAKVALMRLFGWRILSSVRFPFHDHVRKNLHWSNAQVLLRFLLIHVASIWLLVILLIKVR